MITLSVDTRIYSDECISKTVYKLSDTYSISRKSDGDNELLTIATKPWADNKEDISSIVWDTLNDFKARDIIEKETHDIRMILYAKAFGDFDVNESDI